MTLTIYQQDGAAPHTALKVLAWLEQKFGDNLISLKTSTAWPPHPPDLSRLDFFLWGYLKDRVYKPMPNDTEELKNAIKREIRLIGQNTCTSVVRNFRDRLDVVLQQKGRHKKDVTWSIFYKKDYRFQRLSYVYKES